MLFDSTYVHSAYKVKSVFAIDCAERFHSRLNIAGLYHKRALSLMKYKTKFHDNDMKCHAEIPKNSQ